MATNTLPSTHANMIELDLPGAPAPQPAPTAAQLRAAQDVERIDAGGRARALADKATAQALGFKTADTVYAIGTVVNSIGVDNMTLSRSDWAANPTLPEAARAFKARIAAEDRQELRVSVPSLKATPDGNLTRGLGECHMTRRAIEGLATLGIVPGGGAYLAACPAPLLAANVNHWLGYQGPEAGGYRLDAKATAKATAAADKFTPVYVPREATLRVRKMPKAVGKAVREAFAIVGPKYGKCDVDTVAQIAADTIGGDARCTITYDGNKATIDVIFHTNITPTTAVAGEAFKAGIRIQADDTGRGSIKISLLLWRNLCRNLIVIDFAKVLVGSRRHVGASLSIEADIKRHVELANERIGALVSKWDEASVEDVLARYDLQNADQVIEGLVVNKVVHVAGVDNATMIERLTRAWSMEPGYSKTAFVNAITRAAHESPWASPWVSEELESTAGELLFAKVWNVELPEEESADQLLA